MILINNTKNKKSLVQMRTVAANELSINTAN